MQQRNQCESQPDAYAVAEFRRNNCVQHILKQMSNGRFANETKPKTGECDAQLCSRYVAIQMFNSVPCRDCAAIAFLSQLFDACTSRTDETELGCDEKAVGKNKEKYRSNT